ncbi:MAG: DUF1653 domain-containing protein [Pseudomonadota bacterium]
MKPTKKAGIKKGFYYHYKHRDTHGIDDYAYRVLGLARHSETKEPLVLYRPVYENTYLAPADVSARPLSMFLETVEVGARRKRRFRPITDRRTIALLSAADRKLHGKGDPLRK